MLPSVSLYFVRFSRMSTPIEVCARIRDPGEIGLELPPSFFFKEASKFQQTPGGPINFDPYSI